MKARFSLSRKILLFWGASVFMVIALVGGIFLFSLNTYHNNISAQNMINAHRATIEFFRQREEHLQQIAKNFAHRDAVVSTMNLLTKYQDPANYQPLVYDAEKKKLGEIFERLTGISDHYYVAVTDGKDRLSAFHVLRTTTESTIRTTGFVAYEKGQAHLMIKNDHETDFGPADNLPPEIGSDVFTFQKARFKYLTDQGPAVAVRVPVIRLRGGGRKELAGNVIIVDILNDAVFKSLSHQIGMEIRPINQEGGNWGKLDPAIDFIPKPKDVPLLFGGSDRHIKIHGEEKTFGFSKVSVANGNPVVLMLAMPNTDLVTGISAFRDSAAWGTLIFVLIMTPIGLIFFHRIIRRPLTLLMEGVQTISQGRYGEVIDLDSNDELGVLARSFGDMSGIIKEREDDLEETVRERTAELEQEIFERKAMQEQLIQSSKMATLGEMATGVAHELNQPLHIIRLAADNIVRKAQKGLADEEYLVGKLARITKQTERAAAIIDHMRVFGRKPSDIQEKVDPVAVVRSVVSMMGQQLHLAGIEVTTRAPETCRSVMGHQVQVEQVLLNLLSNARDAINENSGTVRKTIDICINNDPGGDIIEIIVTDGGGGIDAQTLERIFEPFYTTKGVGKGTGLGLSISYGIITEMAGTISARNVEGGCQFIISLPALPDTADTTRAIA